ncbi:hypothetical protein E1263_05400 [Kribbella antibiotica]|uniref:Uncharacterized protein n=1 Tax=Kribbella antibiotica TaxID=190195 RepID=A0A4R4ZSJ2_9ACTN|nr:hypothetical protein [Kribbella antibiotica]TDD62048.1 hypothetical protein E1263_05400 [Kribbella antibiotica]
MNEDKPTATHLKKQVNAKASDWVMANKPNGEVVRLADHELLPKDADSFSVTVPFIYGASRAR